MSASISSCPSISRAADMDSPAVGRTSGGHQAGRGPWRIVHRGGSGGDRECMHSPSTRSAHEGYARAQSTYSQAYVACVPYYVKWVGKICWLVRASSRILRGQKSGAVLDENRTQPVGSTARGPTDSIARIVLPNSSVAVTISVATSTTFRRSVREYRRNRS